MLEPPALKRLMGPRALLPLALAVAVIFHFVTAGWNPIGNGVEGECAGQAREMFQRGAWTIDGKLPDAPLVCWLLKISFRLFGVSEFSARAPMAFSVLVAVLFLFLLAERIGGSWRGFLAGMILLCSPGMFTVARTISSGPVFAALLTAAFYCAYRGFEMRNTRRGWLAAFWLCIAVAAVTTGWRAFLYPALVIALMSACYREARIRFQALLSPEGALAALAAIAFVWVQRGAALEGAPMPASRFALLQLAAVFPWSLLLLAPAGAALNRLRQWRPLEFQEAFPLAWVAVSFVIPMLNPNREPFDALPIWAGFSLWASMVIEVTPRRSFLASLASVVVAAVLAWFASPVARELISSTILPCAAFLVFAAASFALEWRNRRKPALLALFAGMIFLGGALINHSVKWSGQSSLAGVSRYLNERTEPAIFFAGTRAQCSSLGFYLDQPFSIVEPQGEKLTALLQQPGPVYVIADRALPAERAPIFQSARYIVITNGAQTNPPPAR